MNKLEKEVLKLIGEDTTDPDVFDSTGIIHIRDSINHGIQQLCMVTGSYQKKYYLPLREDARFYRMNWENDHFGYVVNCWDRNKHRRLNQTDLLKLSMDDPNWLDRNGFAESYFHVGYNYIGIYMRQSASDLVLELDCVVIPKAYTADTDPIKLREAFERAAVQYGVSEYFASIGDATRATEWINKSLETAGLKKLNPIMAERKWQLSSSPKQG